jgi:hypothetical protein
MFISNIIYIIHCLVVLTIVIVPFTHYTVLLELYSLFVPFIVLHWILNNDMCVLTLLESYLSGKPINETFIGRIVRPIFSFNKLGKRFSLESWHIYVITILLYLLALYNLQSTPFGVIKKYYHLLRSRMRFQ